MKKFWRSKNFKIIVILIMTTLSIFAISSYKNNQNLFVTKIVSFILSPIQKGFSNLSDGILISWENTFCAEKFRKKNQELQSEINILRNKLVSFEKYKSQNDQLKSLLSIKETNVSFNLEPAFVIARKPNDLFKSFTIDKGSFDGVQPQNPVITPEGLVGYVTRVDTTSSIVETILDPDVDVGVYNSSTGETGILTGTPDLAKNGLAKMKYLSKQSSTEPKNIIISSGTGGIFPKGLLIGTVVTIKSEVHGASMYAVINPCVDINSLRHVFVIKSFARNEVKTEIEKPPPGNSAGNVKPQKDPSPIQKKSHPTIGSSLNTINQ